MDDSPSMVMSVSGTLVTVLVSEMAGIYYTELHPNDRRDQEFDTTAFNAEELYQLVGELIEVKDFVDWLNSHLRADQSSHKGERLREFEGRKVSIHLSQDSSKDEYQIEIRAREWRSGSPSFFWVFCTLTELEELIRQIFASLTFLYGLRSARILQSPIQILTQGVVDFAGVPII